MKFALPVHEEFAVTAILVTFVLLEKGAMEASTPEVERTERTGTAEVTIFVGTGSRALEFENTDVSRTFVDTF